MMLLPELMESHGPFLLGWFCSPLAALSLRCAMFLASPTSSALPQSDSLTASHTTLRDSLAGLTSCLTHWTSSLKSGAGGGGPPCPWLCKIPKSVTSFSGGSPLTALSHSSAGLCLPGQPRLAEQSLANQLRPGHIWGSGGHIWGSRGLGAVFLSREGLSHEFAFPYI